MNTKSLNSLADLICRAQGQDRTPMGIALAIDAAQRHMSPETAAELEALRKRVAELEADVRRANTLRGDAALLIEKERGCGEQCVDIGDLEAALMLGPEDPHDSPLHHDYRLSRDLPETGGAS